MKIFLTLALISCSLYATYVNATDVDEIVCNTGDCSTISCPNVTCQDNEKMITLPCRCCPICAGPCFRVPCSVPHLCREGYERVRIGCCDKCGKLTGENGECTGNEDVEEPIVCKRGLQCISGICVSQSSVSDSPA